MLNRNGEVELDAEEIKSARERAHERLDLRAELTKFEQQLVDLKVQYEQYFSSLVPFPPDKLHAKVKQQLRVLLKAPFKSSAMGYQLKMLETRYHTYHTYWQRVLREREEGRYVRDVFKADLHERLALEEARSQTALGAAENSMGKLFKIYKETLEKQSGRKQEIDYKLFERNLINRAQEIKDKTGAKKLSFKIVAQDGKVSVRIIPKKEQ